MLKPIDRPLLYALVAIAFALTLNAGVSFAETPKQPAAQQRQTNPNPVALPQQPMPESYWVRVVDEPINLFTGVLALFTIVLAGASIWQGVLTRQGIVLGNKEFVATHRPKIVVLGFQGIDSD